MTAIKQLSQATRVGLSPSLLIAGKAQAASFGFTKIADNSGSWSFFRGKPQSNNQGTIAFSAALDKQTCAIFPLEQQNPHHRQHPSNLFLFGDHALNNQVMVH